MAEASPEIQVGVVVFADAVYNSTGLLTLDTPANRRKVADAAMVEVTSENTKNLQLAIEKGVQVILVWILDFVEATADVIDDINLTHTHFPCSLWSLFCQNLKS